MYLISLVGREILHGEEFPVFEVRIIGDWCFKARFSRPRIEEVLSSAGLSGNQIGSILRILNKRFPISAVVCG